MAGDNIYEKMGKSSKERAELMSQLAAYKKRNAPYDLQFEPNSLPVLWWYCIDDSLPKNHNQISQLATKLFSITPHAAACERIWSRLGWYYGKRRTRLSLEKIEKMQKLASFFITNAKKELPYYGNGKTNEELQSILQDANLYEDDDLEAELNDETNDLYASEDDGNNDDEVREDIVSLDQILDLNAPEILRDLDDFIIEDLEESNDDGNNSAETDDTDKNDIENWNPNSAVEAYL
jgi:hypothetical protein